MNLPAGTVTFLFTDIEGSTKLWEQHPDAMRVALARHDVLLRQAIENNNGVVFKTGGDAFCVAFHTAPDALGAALTAQQALNSELWPDALSLRVRMALHTGATELRDNDYFGQPLNRVARLLGAGHGGQVLLSLPTEELTRDSLPPATTLKGIGEHRLRDLSRPESVFQLQHPDLPSEFPPLKSLDNPDLPNNLPLQLTSFVGREEEMATIESLLSKTRLLTLTGSGGSGKSRLSLQVAAEVLDQYPDGVWLVELAPLADPGLVPQTVASVLNLSEQAGKSYTQTLIESFKSKRLLLLLDNCEHVLSASAQLSDALLRACPHVKILASSREGLGIGGELTYRVPSLSLPDLKQKATIESVSQYEAVRLFVERALFHLPSFVVTNQNAPALASVCHRLDGIPLAIELAAARVRSLSVEEINNKLDNRFRLLTGGSKTALPRQQTLRALIDWSYDLLSAQEKVLLLRLSVFAGGWMLASAEQVGSGDSIEEWEVLDLLTSLADKSLVLAQTQGDTTRYGLLETVRQYARDRLAESGESLVVRANHAHYFLTLAEEVKPKLWGSEQAQWLEVLEKEHDNLRQALTLYAEDVEKDTEAGEKGLRLAADLKEFWWTRGHLSEGRECLSALLAHPGGQARTNARADALNGAGNLAYMQGDYGGARVLFEESLSIYRGLGDNGGIATSLGNLGNVAEAQGNYDGARVLNEESLAMFRDLGYKWGIAYALNNLGNVAYAQDDYAQARVLHEESLSLSRELGYKWGMAWSLLTQGDAAQAQGDYAQARVSLEECLAIAREMGDRRISAYGLEALASLAIHETDAERCARLWGAAAALRESIGSPLSPAGREKQEREMTDAREDSGADAFAAAWAQGQEMTMEQAISYALEDVTT